MPSTWGPRLFWACVFILIVAAVFAWFYDPQAAPDLDRIGLIEWRERPVTVSPQVQACEVRIGLKDPGPTEWKGEFKLSPGKVLHALAMTSRPDSVDGSRFQVASRHVGGAVHPAVVRITYLADPRDQLRLTLAGETAEVTLAELGSGRTELFGGNVDVARATPWQRLHHDGESDDLAPRLFHDRQGHDYLLHLQCERGRTLDPQAVLSGNFDSMQQPIGGVSVRLTKYQQGVWHHSENVTGKLEAALDPVLAADLEGRLFVAWSQPGVEGWDIYYRVKDPAGAGEVGAAWSDPKKLTEQPGPHQQLVAATDSRGKVWLAWQTWHFDHYEIFAAVINDELHAWKKPGPVAEHERASEGRWNPALAADGQGNVWIAWSLFRRGHFDLEATRLNAQSKLTAPLVVAASTRNETQPSLVCDKNNQLWVAYAESEDVDEKEFGHALMPQDKIRVRVSRPDQSFADVPPVPRPGGAGTEKSRETCSQPRLVMTATGSPAVSFRCGDDVNACWLESSGWIAPRPLASLNRSQTKLFAAAAENGQLLVFVETPDEADRTRLHVASTSLPESASPVATTPVPAEQLRPQAAAHWDQFVEMARLFRQRPQDVNLSRRYLLRGLLFFPEAQGRFPDQFAASRMVLEQAMADWILLPGEAERPASQHWWEALRGEALTQKSERSWLNGYYRPTPEKTPPNLILDHRLDYLALPSWAALRAAASNQQGGNASSLIAQESDTKLIEQFLAQQQDIGLVITPEWQTLATINPPSTTTRAIDGVDSSLMPLWRPSEKPTKERAPCLRLVAYADGKSREHLREAIRDRHYYLATDDIYLLARCDKRVPGDVFQTARTPTISVQALGTGKIAKVEIWRDNQLIKTESPPGNAAVLECPNPDIDRKWHFFMVRVVQADGEMAVTQPFWIRYQP